MFPSPALAPSHTRDPAPAVPAACPQPPACADGYAPACPSPARARAAHPPEAHTTPAGTAAAPDDDNALPQRVRTPLPAKPLRRALLALPLGVGWLNMPGLLRPLGWPVTRLALAGGVAGATGLAAGSARADNANGSPQTQTQTRAQAPQGDAAASATAAGGAASAWAGRPTLVLDIELRGDTGDADHAQQHRLRGPQTAQRLRQALRQQAGLQVLDDPGQLEAMRAAAEATYLHRCNGCERDLARRLGADLVAVPWVYRVSNLILTFNFELREVADGRVVFKRALDFRGDNDMAWTRALRYLMGELVGAAAPPAPSRRHANG